MKFFKLIIRTPDEKIFESDEISEVNLNTEMGPMTIYAGHASLSGSILFSRLSVKTHDKEDQYLTRRGTIFVDNEKNEVTILVLSCEKKATIVSEELNEYLGYITNLIESGGDLSQIKLKYLEKERLAVEEQVKELKKN